MPQRVSGKRYAQAAFELALEGCQLDQWASDLEVVAGVFQDPDFNAFLGHVDVPAAEKLRAVETVLAEVGPMARNMVNLLVARGAVDAIADTCTSFTELLDEHLGRQRVGVTTAVPLDDAEVRRITEFVTSLVRREVVVSVSVDESILGGVVIQIGDRLLDGSTQARLNGLRERVHSAISSPAA